MPVTRDEKAVLLQELIEKFGKSKSVVFAQYRGLSVADMFKLRKELRRGNAEMKVAKKTLINLGSKESGFGEIDRGLMEGPVAATFSYEDPLSGIKVLFNFATTNEKLQLLGGIIDGKVVGPEVIQEYAKLPGREELLAKLLGSLNAPVSGTVGLLNNLIAGFVRVINAYKDKLPTSAESAPAAPAATPEIQAAPKEEVKTEETSSDTPTEEGKESA